MRHMDAAGMNADEKKTFDAWWNASPENRAEFETAKEAMDGLGKAEHFPVGEVERIKTRFQSQRREEPSNTPWAIASIVGCITLILIGASMLRPLAPQSYFAREGKSAEYTLKDGTRLTLRAGSQVQISISDEKRIARLLAGAAIFEIAEDPRAFELLAGNYRIQDIGTTFSVELETEFIPQGHYAVGLDVAVDDGAIVIQRSGKQGSSPVLIEAGQSAFWEDTASAPSIENIDETTFALWRTGALVYEDQTLATVLSDLGQIGNIFFQYSDHTLGQLTISGSLSSADIQAALSTLEALHPVKFQDLDDGTVLVMHPNQEFSISE